MCPIGGQILVLGKVGKVYRFVRPKIIVQRIVVVGVFVAKVGVKMGILSMWIVGRGIRGILQEIACNADPMQLL